MTHDEPTMIANGKTVPGKTKSFPWQCPRCLKHEVVPATIEHTAEVRYDGALYRLTIPDLSVPTCRVCGEQVFGDTADEQVDVALRTRLRLLTPLQIQAGIRGLGMRQKEFAARLGVGEETVSRWATGAVVQSRAMDNLLRVYFALPEVRAVLTGPNQNPDLGTRTGPSLETGTAP